MDDRLSIVVTHTDGSSTRWGPHEADVARVPQGLRFGTSVPGGFRDLQCTLARDPGIDHPDLALFDHVRVVGPGNQVAWEGRQQRFPRDAGRQITVDAVGPVAQLRDREDFTAIIVDRDPAAWQGPSRQRRQNMLDIGYSAVDPQARADTSSGAPCITTEVTGAWGSSGLPLAEAWYDAGPGNRIAAIYYAWQKSTTVDHLDGNWTWIVRLLDDDIATAFDSSSNLRAEGPGTGTLTATTSSRRWAIVQLYYAAGPAGGPNLPYNVDWTCLAVIGDHGLTPRGDTDATTGPGFYASDIVEWIVQGAGIPIDDIQQTTHIIRHQAWRDMVTREQAILDVNRFHWHEWGIYDRGFFYREPDENRLCWEARLSAGAQLSLEGEDAEQTINGVVVTYPGVDGRQHTAGPPGSGHETQDTRLYDDSDLNAATRAGLRVYQRLEVSDVTDAAGAVAIGAAYLAVKRRPQRRGQIVMPTGSVRHPTIGAVPAWMVRAGDWVRVSDHPADQPRRIIETSYDHDQRAITCTLDNTAFTIESLMQRIGVAVVGRI